MAFSYLSPTERVNTAVDSGRLPSVESFGKKGKKAKPNILKHRVNTVDTKNL